MVEGLRGKKIVHVAVGALHCLAVTDTGQVCTDLVDYVLSFATMTVLQVFEFIYRLSYFRQLWPYCQLAVSLETCINMILLNNSMQMSYA